MGQDCSCQIIFISMSLHSRAFPSCASRCHSLLVLYFFFSLLVDMRFDAVVYKSGAYTKFYPPQRSRPQNSHWISLHTSKYILSAVNARWWSTTTSGLTKLLLTPQCVHDFYKMLCVLCLWVCVCCQAAVWLRAWVACSARMWASHSLRSFVTFWSHKDFLVLSRGRTSISCVT